MGVIMYYIYKDKVLVTDNTVLDGQLPNDEFFVLLENSFIVYDTNSKIKYNGFTDLTFADFVKHIFTTNAPFVKFVFEIQNDTRLYQNIVAHSCVFDNLSLQSLNYIGVSFYKNYFKNMSELSLAQYIVDENIKRRIANG